MTEAAPKKTGNVIYPAQFQSSPDPLAQLKTHWPDILATVQQGNRATYALLSECHPFATEKGRVVLTAPYPFHRDRLMDRPHHEYVRDALEQVLGHRPDLEITLEN